MTEPKEGTGPLCSLSAALSPYASYQAAPVRLRALVGAPSHISKMVPSTVHVGPPDWIKSRTFTLRVRLAL